MLKMAMQGEHIGRVGKGMVSSTAAIFKAVVLEESLFVVVICVAASRTISNAAPTNAKNRKGMAPRLRSFTSVSCIPDNESLSFSEGNEDSSLAFDR